MNVGERWLWTGLWTDVGPKCDLRWFKIKTLGSLNHFQCVVLPRNKTYFIYGPPAITAAIRKNGNDQPSLSSRASWLERFINSRATGTGDYDSPSPSSRFVSRLIRSCLINNWLDVRLRPTTRLGLADKFWLTDHVPIIKPVCVPTLGTKSFPSFLSA